MRRMTYDYDIVKKAGKLIDLERIKVNREALFEELVKTESELFVAPAIGSRAVKLKDENELKDYLQNERFKLNEIQFFVVPRKDKTIEPVKLAPQAPLKTSANVEVGGSDDVYQAVLKSLKGKGAQIKEK